MKTGKLAMIKGKQGKTARLFLAVLFLCLVPNITVHAKGNQDVILSNPDAIEAAFKKAVDTLAMGLQTPTETIIGSFTIDGSDTPTELSVYLTNKAAEYAENSPSKRYIVVEGSGDNRALLSGSFNKLNDRVDVTVNLTTPTGEGNGTQKLSLSLKEIIRWEVALEIENQENMDALEEIFTALAEEKQESAQIPNTTQGIHIQAWFNSESRTFMHRDELKMTVMADKNCYFKIIHIDADNQMKMIYPNSSDKNNELKANIPRNIFETASYMLYGPYGAETLLVVAQSKPFENIERDYNILLGELKRYNPELENKQRIIAVTKCDILDNELIDTMKKEVPSEIETVFISSVSGMGIDELKDKLWEKLSSSENQIDEITHENLHAATLILQPDETEISEDENLEKDDISEFKGIGWDDL